MNTWSDSRRAFSSIDHILYYIAWCKGTKEAIVCTLCIFRQYLWYCTKGTSPTKTSPRIPSDMKLWRGQYMHYMSKCWDEQVSGRAIRGNQKHHQCQARMFTFSTLFEMYINQVVDYITCGGHEGITIAGSWIHVLLYTDDIILFSIPHAFLNAYIVFATKKAPGKLTKDQGNDHTHINANSPRICLHPFRRICWNGGRLRSSHFKEPHTTVWLFDISHPCSRVKLLPYGLKASPCTYAHK